MKIFIEQFQSPGDILMVTAAVRDLKLAYPYIGVNVHTSAIDLWQNNPLLNRSISRENADRAIRLEYPLIHSSDRLPYHFIHAFRKELQVQLGLQIPQGEFKADLYLSDGEKRLHPVAETHQGYWLIDAGYKQDFTLKNWGLENYQEVVDRLKGKVKFIQIGSREHCHKALSGVIDMLGRTTIRDLIQLMYHAAGVLTPVSFPMHLAAGVPTPDGRLRPCVVVAGGREPVTWEQYPGHQFLHTVGMLDCCRKKSCWRSRAEIRGDGAPSDESLCAHPVKTPSGVCIGACMAAIKPERVADLIWQYHSNR